MASQIDGSDGIRLLLRPIRGRLAAAAALAGLGQALALAPLAGVAEIARRAISGAPAGSLDVALLSLVLLGLGLGLIAAGELLAHLADNWFTDHLRRTLARKLAHAPLGWFTTRASGDVKQAMQDDIGTLHELIAHYYTTRARCLGAIGAAALCLLLVDWPMALIALAPLPAYHLLFGALKKSISAERMRDFAAGQARLGAAVIEFIDGLPVVKAFGASGEAYAGYVRATEGFRRAFLGFTGPLVTPMVNANALIAPVSVLGLVLAVGAAFVRLDWLSPVELLFFALIAPGMSAPLLSMKRPTAAHRPVAVRSAVFAEAL